MTNNHLNVLLASVVLCLAGCGGSKTEVPAEFDHGSVAEGVYENSFFQIRWPIPEGWHTTDSNPLNALASVGKERMALTDEAIARSLEQTDLSRLGLITLSPHPLNDNPTPVPGVILFAESTAHAPGLNDGKDYLKHTQDAVKRTSGEEPEFTKPVETELGGQVFHTADTRMIIGESVVHYRQMVRVAHAHALIVTLMWSTPEELQELQTGLETLEIGE